MMNKEIKLKSTEVDAIVQSIDSQVLSIITGWTTVSRDISQTRQRLSLIELLTDIKTRLVS